MINKARLFLSLMLVGGFIFIIPATHAQTNDTKQSNPSHVPADVSRLVAELHSTNADKRAKAACALGEKRQRASAAIPFLLALLSDGALIDPEESCPNEFPFEDETWKPEFAELKETTVGEAATQALMAIYEPAIQPLISALLKAESWRARKNAAWALHNRGGIRGDVMEALITATRDEAWQVRAQAVHAIGHKSSSELDVIPHLIAALSDEHPRVRESAAGGLWQCADSRAFGPLLEALKDADSDVRRQAADTLGNRAVNETIPMLVAATRDDNEQVRRGARRALEVMKQRAMGSETNLDPALLPK
ncbi:MAG TPA: HEAT repeat domain-containing protein [Blastocatellia bacterium]|nr:HEAT repeat domain-containing protein [Blastocatellia bacterium]